MITFNMPTWGDEYNKKIFEIFSKYQIDGPDIDSFFCVSSALSEIEQEIGLNLTNQFIAALRDYLSKVKHPLDTVSNKVPQELEDEINRIFKNAGL